MRTSRLLDALSLFVAAAAMVAATIGLFLSDGGQTTSFTTIRGTLAHLYGQGLYRNDTLLIGAGFRGQDAVTLFLGVPLLVLATVFGRTGSLRPRLLQGSILSYFVYVYATMSLGAAYNSLFILYVAIFSAGLFALYLAFSLTTELHAGAVSSLPRVGPAILLLASGVITVVIWLVPLVSALAAGAPPQNLDSYTTIVTDALDLGIVAPVAVVTGVLVLRRSAFGYRVAFLVLGLLVMLLPVIVVSTMSQVQAGVAFTPGEVIGPVVGFLLLGGFGVWAVVALLLSLGRAPSLRRA